MPVITPGVRDYLSDPSILKGSSKKNYIQENIKHLKQLERKTKKDKKKEGIPIVFSKRPLGRSQSKFGRKKLVESKSSKSLVKSAPRSPTTQVELAKSSTKSARSLRYKKSFKAQGSQTGVYGDESDSESQVFRQYRPKSGNKKDPSLQAGNEQGDRSFSPFSLDDIKREMKAAQDVDYVKLNQLVQYKPKQMRNAKWDQTKAPPTYQRGVLPKYLREQRKDVDSSEERADSRRNVARPNVGSYNNTNLSPNKKGREKESACPPGHILISDLERKQQLNEMRKHYADLINKLNRIPVNVDTLKARQMKTELENELENLEAGITLFSKDKLFVKVT